MHTLNTLFRKLIRQVDSLGMEGWIMMGAIVLVIGFYCMRGFGNLKSY